MRIKNRLNQLEDRMRNDNDGGLVILTTWPNGEKTLEDADQDLTSAARVQLLWERGTVARPLTGWLPADMWNRL